MPRVVAMDIGTWSVKATAFRTSGRTFEVDDRFEQVIPQQGEIPPEAHQLAALDALLDEHPEWADVATDKGALWPATRATFRRITLPFNDAAKVAQTLPFAVEAEVPFDMDEMAIGTRILTSEDKTEALVLLTRHDDVEDHLLHLAERSLDPRILCVDADLQGYWAHNETSPTVVLDVGHTHTTITVVVDGFVAWCRSLNVAGAAITRAIARTLDIPWREAEAIKHGTAATEPSPDEEITDIREGTTVYTRLPQPVRQAVDGQIGLLLAEIRSSLIAAEDALELDLSKVILVGGGATWPEIRSYLAQDLGLTVAKPMDHEGDAVPVRFAASHALAMQLAGQASGAIDLRVGDLKFEGGVDFTKAAFTYGGAGLAFFAFAAVVMFAIQFRSLAVEQAETESRLTAVVSETFPDVPANLTSDTTTALAVMKEETAAATERSEVLDNMNSGVPPTMDTVYALTNAFPAHPDVVVDLTELTISKTAISFEAETDGYASSDAVEKALQETERFASAKKGDDRKKGSGTVTFPVNIPLVEDAEEEG